MVELTLYDGKIKLDANKAEFVKQKFELSSSKVIEVLTYLSQKTNEK